MTDVGFLNRKTPPHIFTLVMVAGLSALSMNVFLPSLPAMAAHFETQYAVMQLSISGYLAATACVQLVVGPLSDLFGRRPVMLVSLCIMCIATLVCFLAPNVGVFMVARFAQASVATCFVLARAVVRDMVPANQAASMIGYVTMGMSVVPMVGPMIGGVLNDIGGWQASFLLLMGLTMLVIALVYFDLGETNRQKSTSFSAQFKAWPELLKSRLFWGYALTSTFSSGLFFSFLGGAPFIGSTLYGLTPAMLGVQFFFMAAGYMLGNFISGRYASDIGIIRMMVSGNLIAMTGIVIAIVLANTGLHSPYAFFMPLALIGVGNGVTLPSSNAGMVSVKPHLAGSASGLGGALTIGGGAALSVIATSLLSPTSGTQPLLFMMVATGLLALYATYFTRKAERQEASRSQRDDNA